MIVQACLNGARPPEFHPTLPLKRDDLARQASECVAAGADELHFHPRNSDGRESLRDVDDWVRAVRLVCPHTPFGVSTGAWIEGDPARTRSCIEDWRTLPDYASVNLSEPDAPAVIETLQRIGVGVEAGLATVTDALRLAELPQRDSVLRVLIEIEEQDLDRAFNAANTIEAVLNDAGIRRPILLHGLDFTVWPLADRAIARGWSIRVGLEDGNVLPDGNVASGNVELISAAVSRLRAAPAYSRNLELGHESA